MKTFKDVLGQDVSVGDYIGYATRSGNSGLLKIGKVLNIFDEPRFSICVLSVYQSSYKSIQQKGANTRLDNTSNIVKIHENAVPENYKKVLGGL